MLKYHIQTSGRSLRTRIDFNDIRTSFICDMTTVTHCILMRMEAITTPTRNRCVVQWQFSYY
jgi:methylmalonyl-CoA mutase N-terminal domain/subunit